MEARPINTCKTLVLDGSLAAQKREELKEYFQKTFDIYENLFACIAHEDAYYLRAEPLRHPLIFYYGHTATFSSINLFLDNTLTKELMNDLNQCLLLVLMKCLGMI